MAQLKQGKNYNVESQTSATLFGLQGFVEGRNWYIGIYLNGGPNNPRYVLNAISPVPALQTILDVIEEDVAYGNEDKIKWVMICSRIAIRLILEGAIKTADFANATEGTFDTSTFMEKGKVLPVISLPGVHFGSRVIPVLIFSEVSIGSESYATLDADGEVV